MKFNYTIVCVGGPDKEIGVVDRLDAENYPSAVKMYLMQTGRLFKHDFKVVMNGDSVDDVPFTFHTYKRNKNKTCSWLKGLYSFMGEHLHDCSATDDREEA